MSACSYLFEFIFGDPDFLPRSKERSGGKSLYFNVTSAAESGDTDVVWGIDWCLLHQTRSLRIKNSFRKKKSYNKNSGHQCLH